MIRRSKFSLFFRRSKVSINIRSLEFHEIKTIFQEIESFNNAFKVLIEFQSPAKCVTHKYDQEVKSCKSII
jgi:hypothetical protein